jgi:hypothetical protein
MQEILERPTFNGPEERFNDERMAAMIDNLAERGILKEGKRFAVGVISGNDPDSDVARAVEYGKFEKQFENSYQEMEGAYKPFDESSTFLVMVDMVDRKPAGEFRLVHPGPEGSVTLNDLANPNLPWGGQDMLGLINTHNRQRQGPLDESQILDVATLARAEEYDIPGVNKLISSALYLYTRKYAHENGYSDLVTIFDTKPFDKFQKAYESPWQKIPGLGEAPYMQKPPGKSIPLYLNLEEYDERLQRENPQVYEFLETGVGPAGDITEYVNFPDQA